MDWNSIYQTIAPWVSLAGTGLGIGGSIYGNILGQRAYNNQNRVANNYNAIIQSIVAQNAANQARQAGMMGDWLNNAWGLISSRPDWHDYYTPMTEAAAAATRRGVNANAQSRGFADSAYADAMVGEGLAKNETDRYIAAQGLADRAYSAQLGALGPLLGAANSAFSGNIGYPPGFMMPPANPYQSAGATGSFGNFLQYQAILDGIKRANAVNTPPSQTLLPISYGPATGYSLYGDVAAPWYNEKPFMLYDTP